VNQNKRGEKVVEAVLRDTEPAADRSGVLIGMAACALSGGIMGFIAGFLVGIWF
jgi:hypothetical protein